MHLIFIGFLALVLGGVGLAGGFDKDTIVPTTQASEGEN